MYKRRFEAKRKRNTISKILFEKIKIKNQKRKLESTRSNIQSKIWSYWSNIDLLLDENRLIIEFSIFDKKFRYIWFWKKYQKKE